MRCDFLVLHQSLVPSRWCVSPFPRLNSFLYSQNHNSFKMRALSLATVVLIGFRPWSTGLGFPGLQWFREGPPYTLTGPKNPGKIPPIVTPLIPIKAVWWEFLQTLIFSLFHLINRCYSSLVSLIRPFGGSLACSVAIGFHSLLMWLDSFHPFCNGMFRRFHS